MYQFCPHTFTYRSSLPVLSLVVRVVHTANVRRKGSARPPTNDYRPVRSIKKYQKTFPISLAPSCIMALWREYDNAIRPRVVNKQSASISHFLQFLFDRLKEEKGSHHILLLVREESSRELRIKAVHTFRAYTRHTRA